jgi:hypothetical protein
VQGGFKTATTDLATVQRWWRQWPAANIGIATGDASGLVVVDVDPDHGGVDTIRSLIGRNGPLPRGPVVRTGSGGWHLYFRHPGHDVRNSAGLLGAGLDVRADGGYIIGPPSRHATGGAYRWREPVPGLPDLPDWLLTALERPQAEPRTDRFDGPVRLDRTLSAWARAALHGEAERVRTAPQGQRNHTLNRAAFSLGQIVESGILDASTVEHTLMHSALTSGLGEREAALTIRSGLTAGRERPRTPEPPHLAGSLATATAVETPHNAVGLA